MNLADIPKILWYSISVSLLLLTGSFAYVSISSGQLSIKWNDFEATSGDVRRKTEQLESEIDSLVQEKAQTAEEIISLKSQIGNLISKLQDASGVSEDLVEEATEIKDTIDAQSERNQEQIQSLQVKRNTITDLKLSIPESGSASSDVSKKKKVLLDNLWAKSGYFLVIEGNIRLNVDKVDGGTVSIRITKNDRTLGQATLSVGESYSFEDAQSTYTIDLNSIGSAGANFFKKAAFFTVDRD